MPAKRRYTRRAVAVVADPFAHIAPGAEAVDPVVAGLILRKSTGGRGAYAIRYTAFDGLRYRHTIGHGAMSIEEARTIARRLLAEASEGRNIAAEHDALRNAPTMNELWRRLYETRYAASHTDWSAEVKRIYEHDIAPVLGRMLVARVEERHVAALLKQRMAHAPFASNRARSILVLMFKAAERWKLRAPATNPVAYVEPWPEPARRRFASVDEMQRLVARLREVANDRETWGVKATAAVFVLTLLFTGARPSELQRARPADVERQANGRAILRLKTGKNGDPRDIVLPPTVVALLDTLPPSPRLLIPPVFSLRPFWKGLCEGLGIEDLRVYDLRRSFATTGLSAGVPIGVIGEMLGHRSTQTTRRYARLRPEVAADAAVRVAEIISPATEWSEPAP